MVNSVFEFKLLMVVLGVLLIAGLTMTRSHEKCRPQFLLAIFLVYVSFQLFHFMEYFPATSFQRYSRPSEKTASYYRMVPVLDGGSVVQDDLVKTMPVLGQGRLEYFLRRAFRSQQEADQLAADYRKIYELKVRGSGAPDFLGLRLERKKWDWRRDPYDPTEGYTVQKKAGDPQGGLNA